MRLQTTDAARFRGPLQCLAQTLRLEGVGGLYKGATPPLVGWMLMDSVMLGSLSVYRRLVAQHLYGASSWTPGALPAPAPATHLPPLGHALAGVLAGATVSFVAAPVEHVKARLQVQYAAQKADRLYASPLDCLARIYRHHGVEIGRAHV